MEYFHSYGMSPSNINNYMTAIRSMCIIYGQDTAFMRDQRIHLFIKAITINRPLKPSLPHDHILLDMIQIIENLEHPIVYQALYLLCFFSFLCLSNILPHSVNTFDITRQLCRGDLIFPPHNVVILIKWSKTMQDRHSVSILTIPALGSSSLCPVRALDTMCHVFPATSNEPLVLYFRQGHFLPLTDYTQYSQYHTQWKHLHRKHLKKSFNIVTVS